jgi:hypothetical protein
MTSVLVDSNVVIDLVAHDPVWEEWSAARLARLAVSAVLVINPIIYAEVSAGFSRIEDVDELLPLAAFRREQIPYEAAFLAGKCQREYRDRGGARLWVLPDFLIGAHAAIRGHRLLTRDARRFRTYFPRLHLIAPE